MGREMGDAGGSPERRKDDRLVAAKKGEEKGD